MRSTCLLLVFLFGSCSLFDSKVGGLRQLWQVEQVLQSMSRSEIGATGAGAFFAIRDRSLTSYNLYDGSVNWIRNIRQDCKRVVFYVGRVFCPSDGLYAFDAETGEPLWTLASDTTLSLVEGTADPERAYAATLTSVVAADAATGAPLWRRSFSGPGWTGIAMRSLTLTPEGDLLVAFDALYDSYGYFSAAAIVAVDPTTGAERWRYQDGDQTTDRSIGGLTIWNDLLLYSDATGQEAVAVDRSTRAVRWRRPWTRGYLGNVRAPVVADGVAYWSSGDARLYAADAATGAERWSVRPDRGGFYSHEVCGPVVLGHNGALVVVDRATGRRRGVLFDTERVGQLAVADGRVYVSTERGVYAFDCG